MNVAVGVDLGGTNVRAAVYGRAEDAGLPTTRAEDRFKLGDDLDPARLATRIAAAVLALDPPAGAPVGVGLAGMLRGTSGVVANAPNLDWREVPFAALLADHLPGHRVFLYNDVNAIAYGEYAFGAGRGVSDVLCIFAGTGIGGGYVAGGRLVPGASGAAGEIGHTKVTMGADAPPCHCGQRGCVEAYAGGRVLGDRLQAELRAGIPGLERILALAGGDVDAVHPGHLDEAAAEGDRYAVAIYDAVTPLLGMVLANAVTLLNPGRLVMGGGMWTRAPEFARRVLAVYRREVGAAAGETCEVVTTALGDDAGILGASALALVDA